MYCKTIVGAHLVRAFNLVLTTSGTWMVSINGRKRAGYGKL